MTQVSVSQVINESGVAFGTSGARGLVTDFKPEVCAAFTLAFIQVMQQSFGFDRLAIAIDNRPSSPDIAAACIAAAKAVGIEVDYYGVIPTPALAVTSMADNIPAIMVTGSHIPFDRNGLKFYRPDGEISKADELAILVANVALPAFTIKGLPNVSMRATEAYIARYLDLYDGNLLSGKRIGIYEHSSAGRDLYASLFEQLGATVISLGRSDSFVPIDTEAVALADIEMAQAWQKEHHLDALFSTDGDGDRPLVADENGEWLRGDILGVLCSQAMKVESLVVPVSCNTMIEALNQFKHVERTKIGSPYVIAEFAKLANSYASVAGFEANGGYLLGTDMFVNGKIIKALPTRDAVLPALMLFAASGKGISHLVSALPKRVTYSDREKDFATEKSLSLLERGKDNPVDLLKNLGFSNNGIKHVDVTDGLRIILENDDVLHLRPSGNAPELRCYAESTDIQSAKFYVDTALTNARKI
ncbi:phosphomannomutase [Shewanella insulae]|uniref:phosphomannomutase n=1 Tax=Shewanella insulae TaxID=2681496 RepID=UPI0024817369|nr:phosphomannomutase [Shewanella insulae]